jgi:hypothetical protein
MNLSDAKQFMEDAKVKLVTTDRVNGGLRFNVLVKEEQTKPKRVTYRPRTLRVTEHELVK